jgi:hypothetical protein
MRPKVGCIRFLCIIKLLDIFSIFDKYEEWQENEEYLYACLWEGTYRFER